MKNIKFLGAFLAFILTTSLVQGQENTLLWSVSGNGLKEPSYVFGTMHMMCDSSFEIKDKVKAAFNSCKQVYLEIDLDDPEEIKQMTTAAMGEKKLTEILTPDQQKRLDEKLQAELNMSLSALDNYSLLTISSLLMIKEFNCNVIKSYEQEFMALAAEKGMEVKGLEKIAYQLSCLNQSADTDKMFNDLFDEKRKLTLDTLLSAYQTENVAGLLTLFSENDYLDEKATEWLLKKRNANWVDLMPKIMKKRPTFFAVGAAHLLYNYGVLDLLRTKGYTVSPVF